MKRIFVLFVAALLSQACTWVPLTDAGKAIRVVKMEDVANCENKGKVVVSVKDKIAGFDRNEDKVKRELEKLARNSVVELKMDGDSIVPTSKIKDGKQTFAVYKCMVPKGTE